MPGELAATPKLLEPNASVPVAAFEAFANGFAPPNPDDTLGILVAPPNPKDGLAGAGADVNGDPAAEANGDCEVAVVAVVFGVTSCCISNEEVKIS